MKILKAIFTSFFEGLELNSKYDPIESPKKAAKTLP